MLDNGLNALHALPYNIAINFDYFSPVLQRSDSRIRVSNSPEVTQILMVELGCEFRPFQLRFHAGNSSSKISIHLYSTLLIIFLTISNLLLILIIFFSQSLNFSNPEFPTSSFFFKTNKLFVEILYLFIIMRLYFPLVF